MGSPGRHTEIERVYARVWPPHASHSVLVASCLTLQLPARRSIKLSAVNAPNGSKVPCCAYPLRLPVRLQPLRVLDLLPDAELAAVRVGGGRAGERRGGESRRECSRGWLQWGRASARARGKVGTRRSGGA